MRVGIQPYPEPTLKDENLMWFKMVLMKGIRSDCCEAEVFADGCSAVLVVGICGNCKIACSFIK